MKYINDSIYFVVGTNIDLKENAEIAICCIKKIVDFLERISDISLMFSYVDNKGIKLKKVNDKSKVELEKKLLNKEIYAFLLNEYMRKEDYFFEEYGAMKVSPTSFCVELGNPCRWKEIGTYFDGISVSIPIELAMKDDIINEFLKLYKECHLLIKGVYSFITRGTYESTMKVMNGSSLIDCYYTGNIFWDEYVSGYFWGNVLNHKQIQRIKNAGKSIENTEHYLIDKWGENTYIQSTKDIFAYSIDDARKMRELLIDSFPPLEHKERSLYASQAELNQARKSGVLHYILDEDLL